MTYRVAFLWLILTASVSWGQVHISEFMASNSTQTIDPDFSEFGDWIELHNAGTTYVDLSGYSLTDDANEPARWTFPAGRTIPANGYLVVWADSKDTVDDALHTNFGLNNNGEYIGLYHSDGSLMDAVEFDDQMRDISMGRSTTAPDTWLFFAQPTPGAANTTWGIASDETAPIPIVDLPSGQFNAGQSVRVYGVEPVYDVRYTLDGSTPTRTSSLYQAPLAVDSTMVLSVRAFGANVLPSPVVQQTYIIEPNIQLPIVSLITEPRFLWSDDAGLYNNTNIDQRKGWERPGLFEYFAAGSPQLRFSADFRLFGRTAIYIPEKSFAVFPNDPIPNLIFQDVPVTELSSFLLRSSSDDWHRTMFRDGLMHNLLAGHFKLDRMAYQPAVLFLNGEYWGIHNLREKYNEDYIESYYGYDRDSIDLLYIDLRSNSIEVLAGDDAGYQSLLDFASNSDLSDSTQYDFISGLMDIENFVDFVIAQAFVSNPSWSHNIRAWRPHTADGKWQWLIFDLDRGFNNINDNILNEIYDRYDLFRELVENQKFLSLFLQRVQYHMNVSFQPDRVHAVIDSLAAQIEPEMPRHIEKWADECRNSTCGISSMAYWMEQVSRLYEFATQRPDVFLAQVSRQFGRQNYANLDLQIMEQGFGTILINDDIRVDEQFSGSFLQDSHVQVQAVANPGYNFQHWLQVATNTESIDMIAIGSDWLYQDDGSDLDSAWIDPGFDDSAWQRGFAQLGYGDGDEITTLSYGPDAGNKFITTYFRKDFLVEDPARFESVTMRLLRDDGAVAYLNGKEVVRSNMPDGRIDFETRASSTVGGGNEDNYFEFTIDPATLRPGANTIAVEIHQTSPTSSDISFDMQLTGVLGEQSSNDVTPLPAGSVWRYLDDGSDADSSWTQLDYDDAAWSSGAAQLGYGDGDETTEISFGGDANDKNITTYFRKTFYVNDASAYEMLTLHLLRDDGAVVYLNGQEIVRSNMPDGDVTSDTRATTAIGGGDENTFHEFMIDPVRLQDRANILTVEIHQANPTSSDISFDLELTGILKETSGSTIVSEDAVYQFTLTGDLELVAVFQERETNQLPERIEQDYTLVREFSPYFASGDVFVDENAIVSIEPGVEIRMPADASIQVMGTLLALGEKEHPVTIRGKTSDRWGALIFTDAVGQSRMQHVGLTGASNGPDPQAHAGALSVQRSTVHLDHVRIEDVVQAVYVNQGIVEFSGCYFDGMNAGDDVFHAVRSQVTIHDCDFVGNGELDFDFVDDSIIRNSRFTIISENPNRDGIDIGSSQNIIIQGNIIRDCPDKGISIGEGSTAELVRNLIIDCGRGIAVKDSSMAIIRHNTLYRNNVAIACYEKNAGMGGGHAAVVNSIFSQSISDNYAVDEKSSLSIRYSLSDSDSLTGDHNKLGNPLFVAPMDSNFHLLAHSPAIDAGDPDSPLDPDGSRADMGAFYFDKTPHPTVALRINEVSASNTSVIADTAGEFDDWIEVYNDSDQPVDMAGLFLTDDPADPLAWQIPGDAPDFTTIPPKGFLLLWADNDPDQGPHHLDFRLSADGEFVGLYRIDVADTMMIDTLQFSSMADDISYGRLPDGSDSFQTFFVPSPGRSNSLSVGQSLSLHSPPDSSVIEIKNAEQDTVVQFVWSSAQLANTADELLGYEYKLLNAADVVVLGTVTADTTMSLQFSTEYNGEYRWFVTGRSKQGMEAGSDTARLYFKPWLTNVEDGNRMPRDFVLHQNYPNPFNPGTNIRFEVPANTDIRLTVYNTMGRRVRTLHDGRIKAGYHQLFWNAMDESGQPVSSGLYFYRLQGSAVNMHRKMLLIR